MFATLATTAVVTHAGPWAAGFGWVFFLIPVFWFLVIGLIIFLVTRNRRRYWAHGGPDDSYGPPWMRAGGRRLQRAGQPRGEPLAGVDRSLRRGLSGAAAQRAGNGILAHFLTGVSALRRSAPTLQRRHFRSGELV